MSNGFMEAIQQTKNPDPQLKEDPISTGRKIFVLKFKTNENMGDVMKLLRKNGGLNQRVIDGEILTYVDKDAIIELKKHKDLQDKYEVW